MVQKCEFCKLKKVNNLLGFSCKCGLKNLCTTCRYAEDHKCTFNFREESKKDLEKNNPKIIGYKLNKI
jgi:hypothetical protein